MLLNVKIIIVDYKGSPGGTGRTFHALRNPENLQWMGNSPRISQQRATIAGVKFSLIFF